MVNTIHCLYFVKNYYKPKRPVLRYSSRKDLTGDSQMPVGKYQGKKLKHIPAGYLLWVETKDNLPVMVKKWVEQNREMLTNRVINENRIYWEKHGSIWDDGAHWGQNDWEAGMTYDGPWNNGNF